MSEREVTFVEADRPALPTGTYSVTVTQTVNQPPPNRFQARRRFAVAGERFALAPAEVAALFPPDLANGEYSGALPHVVLSKPTLPWERTAVAGTSTPWLALLLLDEEELPRQQPRTAAELIPFGEEISVKGSDLTGRGALDAGIVSYPNLNPLDYGERPDQELVAVDLPPELFSRVAPSAADLALLAHVRAGDTIDVEDTAAEVAERALVLGNRLPEPGRTAHALLVSLEQMARYLPADDGTPSRALDGVRAVRLTVLRAWSFTANRLGETFLGLLQALNVPPLERDRRISSLRLPLAGAAPSRAEVDAALSAQLDGSLSADGARVLVDEALQQGYAMLGEQLRFGGETVAWYRGPLAPAPLTAGSVRTPIACADAANRYDPSTGIFDVSYAAAWQLGQLLALQSSDFALSLYNWRRDLRTAQVVAAEHELIARLLGGALPSLSARREQLFKAAAVGDDDPPPEVVRWLAHLRRLEGVPFNYLVPDERMLPPESLRRFQLDEDWIVALLDGAFSIGRATTGDMLLDARHAPRAHALAAETALSLRPNPAPRDARADASEPVTGFLLRSQLVSGWARLGVVGYRDAEMEDEAPKLRMAQLSHDVMICLFAGDVAAIAIHEPPEQLHCGVEGRPGALVTTLRQLDPPTPGRQLRDPGGDWATAPVAARADQRTLRVATTARAIDDALETRFGQRVATFTSAELALELVKGVVRVEFA